MLNASQQTIYNQAIDWYKHSPKQTFEISGPPGSGKTYLINQIIKALKIPDYKIAPMAYTGAAAINMRTKGMMNAKTCFSWLYNRVTEPIYKNGIVVMDKIFNKPKTKTTFTPKPKSEFVGIDLIIIDEAGSIPPEMRSVIDATGIKVLAAGDLDQLPPIFGTSGYLNDPSKVHFLNEIVRQSEGSAIIKLSQLAKNGSGFSVGNYGNVLVIYEDQLTDEMIKNSQIIICGYNSTRDKYTNYIRNKILGYNSELPMLGERLVCRKNNWSIQDGTGINLTNGLLGNCTNAPDRISRSTKTFDIDFKPDLSTNYFQNLHCSYPYFIANSDIKKQIKNSIHYNIGELFEFGYTITTHMAQGSEFRNGIYIEEPMGNLTNKLNYVGLTRFKESCIYVKHKK